MSARTPDEIREAFAALRDKCDPQGHDLLAELENACLVDNAMLNLHERLGETEARLAAIVAPGQHSVHADRLQLVVTGGAA